MEDNLEEVVVRVSGSEILRSDLRSFTLAFFMFWVSKLESASAASSHSNKGTSFAWLVVLRYRHGQEKEE